MPQFMLHSDFGRFAHTPVVYGYLEAMLWSAVNDEIGCDGGNCIVSEFAPETLERALSDCGAFEDQAGAMIEGERKQAGRDFWLTRNGHGAGFWDGDWEEHGDALTAIAKLFGETSLYRGEDGLLYLS